MHEHLQQLEKLNLEELEVAIRQTGMTVVNAEDLPDATAQRQANRDAASGLAWTAIQNQRAFIGRRCAPNGTDGKVHRLIVEALMLLVGADQ